MQCANYFIGSVPDFEFRSSVRFFRSHSLSFVQCDVPIAGPCVGRASRLAPEGLSNIACFLCLFRKFINTNDNDTSSLSVLRSERIEGITIAGCCWLCFASFDRLKITLIMFSSMYSRIFVAIGSWVVASNKNENECSRLV